MEGRPDLEKAGRFFGNQNQVIFSEGDVATALDDVIVTLETPDVTTICASGAMFLLAKYIKENTDSVVSTT